MRARVRGVAPFLVASLLGFAMLIASVGAASAQRLQAGEEVPFPAESPHPSPD